MKISNVSLSFQFMISYRFLEVTTIVYNPSMESLIVKTITYYYKKNNGL